MCSVAASCRRGVGEPLARLDSMLPFVGLDGLGEFRAQRFAVLPSVSRRCIGKHILDGTAIVPTVRYEDINFLLLLRCHGEFLSLVDYCLIVSLYTKTNRMSSSNFVLSLMRALPAARQRARDGGRFIPSKTPMGRGCWLHHARQPRWKRALPDTRRGGVSGAVAPRE